MPLAFGAQGVTPSLRGQPTNVFNLASGQAMLIPPGAWSVRGDPYTQVQQFDPQVGIWQKAGANGAYEGAYDYVNSDGVNWRVINPTGCPVGAIVTTYGAGYTSAPTITPSAGTSKWQAIMGGVVNTSTTIANAGTGYLYPPLILISSPGIGGVQATATCAISSGTISSVTINNQGAGYTSTPVFTVANDYRDAVGAGGVVTGSTTGSGAIGAIICTDYGTGGLTALPTLTISGGGYTTQGVATVVMDWTITAVTVGTAGSGYTAAAGYAWVTGLIGGISVPTITTQYTNPYISNPQVAGSAAGTWAAGLQAPRLATILVPTSASGVLTATGSIILDGGRYQGAVTQAGIIAGTGIIATAAAITFAMGGAVGTVWLNAA